MDRQDKLDFLAQSIQKAKKVMQEVDAKTGDNKMNSQGGRKIYTEDDYDQVGDNTRYLSEAEAMRMNQLPKQIQQPAPAYDLYDNEKPLPHFTQPQSTGGKFQPYKNLNTSKMPKEILESFLQTPTIDPTKPLGMESLVEKIVGNNPRQQPQQQPRRQEPIIETRQPIVETKSSMDIQLLEYVIKKTVEETLKQVSESTNLNENIQIKIGDKIFGGKISSLKNTK